MAYSSDEDYERAVRVLRQDAGVDERFCPDLIFVLDRLVRKDRLTSWQAVPDEQIEGKAHYDSATNTISLSEGTFSALDKIANAPKVQRRAARFTVAHELAHYSRGHEGRHYRGHLSALSKVPSRMRMNEADANRLAAAFLTPLHLVQQVCGDRNLTQISIEDISDIFDVNQQVARFRKPVLERMYRRLNDEPRLLPDAATEILRQLEGSSGRPLESLKVDEARRRQVAKSKGYEDKHCEQCKNFTLRKRGNIVACETCGATGGINE